MADVRESLANNLTPHGVPLEMIGGRGTADASEILRGLDYAHLLALVEPRQAAMLMAKYLGDRQEERKLRVWWRVEVVDQGKAKGWKLNGRVDRMAESTLSENLGYGTRCSVCDGTAERMIDNLPVACPGCQGAGFLPYSPGRLVNEIGITMVEFDRTWRERIGWCRRALNRWEAGALEALVRRL